MSVFEKGLLGEVRAALYLKKQGMRILERRYRCAHGEIDLIALDGSTLVFVEVKFRAEGRIGEGMQAIGADKIRHMRAAASHYLSSHPGAACRFDAVEISAAGIRHLKNIC